MPEKAAFLVRMDNEKAELSERIEKLNNFLSSAKYNELTETEQLNLTLQFNAMAMYLYFLGIRIEYYEKNRG